MVKVYSKTIPGALVLHDILIESTEEKTSQIDLLIIGNKGIYVLEVKTFADAKIYGDVNKSKWYYYKYGHKYEIYSPVIQNKNHMKYLKSFLKDFGDIPYFSVITMICDDFKLSGNYPENTVICSSLPAMEKGLRLLAENNENYLDDSQKQAIYDYIKTHQIDGKLARLEHKQQVIEYQSEVQGMREQKLCPYCKEALVLREGKYGGFYGCPRYPKCRYTLKK
jgi:hypothetical protein